MPDILISIILKTYLLKIFRVWIDSVNDKERIDDVFTVRLVRNHRSKFRHVILDLEMIVSHTDNEGCN